MRMIPMPMWPNVRHVRPLFADVAIGPGNRFEALVRDRIAADDGDAVGPILEASLGLSDCVKCLLQILAQGAVRARLLELVGLIARVLRLIGRAAHVLLELTVDSSAFLGEPLACVVGIHPSDPTCGQPGGLHRRCLPSYPNVNAYPLIPGS